MSTLKKILMVDDDADLREALADQLVHDRGVRRLRGRPTAPAGWRGPRSSTTTS